MNQNNSRKTQKCNKIEKLRVSPFSEKLEAEDQARDTV